jgi:hypothetical protein
MFNQKSVKWSFLITSVLILAACGEVGPSPSLSSSSASSSTPNSISQSSSSSSSSQPPVQYTITFKNYDDSVLYTTNVIQGQNAVYQGPTPTRPATSEFTYVFTGWDRTLTNVTSAFTTTAQFNQTLNYIPITNAQELNNIRNNLSGSYHLMNDIDLESNEWTPIGTDSAPFTGMLDGKEFTISNLKITTSQVYVGLIGYNQGTIKNLKLANVDINVTGGLSSNIYGGALIGYNNSNSNLENIHTLSGELYIRKRPSNLGRAGGLIGYHRTNQPLNNFSNNINVKGELVDTIGGLVGWVFNPITISNSANSGSVNGGDYVGGLVGLVFNPVTISNSANSGSVNGGDYVGGLVGYGNSSVNILNTFNSGSVSGVAGVGGLIGRVQRSLIISSSFNIGSVNGGDYVGGLVGFGNFNSVTISNSFNSGSLNGGTSVGGLVGFVNSSITISNSFNSGSVSGGSRVGGLVGWVFNPITISNSFNSGSVNGTNSVGGLVGISETSLYIYYSVNFGNVVATDEFSVIFGYRVGGITGVLPTTNDIEQTYYFGSITANGVEVNGVAFGTKVTDLSTFNLAFFTTTLEWDTEIWDFTGLNIANGVYPTLKNMPVVED